MTTWSGPDFDGLMLHTGQLTLGPSGAQQPDTTAAATVAASVTDQRHRFTVAENSTGAVVGEAVLGLAGGAAPSGELSCRIIPEYRNRGFAGEVLGCLTRFGLAHGLQRMQLSCSPSNLAAIRLALRSGYRFEGVARGGPTEPGAVADAATLADAATFARLPTDPDAPVAPAWPPMRTMMDAVIMLRPMGPDDWPVVLAEANDELVRYWSFDDSAMDRQSAVRIAETAGMEWLVGRTARLVICDAASGAGAGTVSLRQAGPPGVVGIGYGLLPDFRGRGFTSRALRLIAEWAFGEAAIARLELGCKAANIASAKAAAGAGFVNDARYAGRLRNPDGSYSDEIGFGLTRDRYHASAGAAVQASGPPLR